MTGSYAIYLAAGIGAIGVSATTLMYRRMRERQRLRRLGAQLGWRVRLNWSDRVLRRAGNHAFMGIGHSRRINALFEPRPGVFAFSYSYETGTDLDRLTHSWRVVLCEVPRRLRWSVLTDQDWLIAAARVRRMHLLDLARYGEPDSIQSPHAFLTDDPETWEQHMTPRLAAFLTQQSRERSWELSPGLIAAFEPGAFLESEMAAMVEQCSRLAQLLLVAFDASSEESPDESSSLSLASTTESAG